MVPTLPSSTLGSLQPTDNHDCFGEIDDNDGDFQKEFKKSIFSSQLTMIIVMLKSMMMMRWRKLMVTLRMKGPFVHC